VLLAVAFSALLRVKAIIDVALGTGFLRTGLLIVGLATVIVAASLLVAQRDVKRMLAYSSMENMGLIAIAASVGTTLAIAALLLHVLAHGIAKTVLFLSAGQLQASHDSTRIVDLAAVLTRSRTLGTSFGIGVLVLLGLPPFAMFASELSIARSLTNAHLAWALGVTLLFILVAFAAVAANTARMLLGQPDRETPPLTSPATITGALLVGVAACLTLGITAGPLTHLFHLAATNLGAGA
jgi:hydrogenase-4 component F